jgi:Nucleotidyltransferase of unknown function (DUF6036)
MPTDDTLGAGPPEPWRSFLRELDALLSSPVELHCLGGFVITQQYGIGRETSDIDYLALTTRSRNDDIEALAGLGSPLYRKYRLYMQCVGIATPPADYASRLIPMFRSAPWACLKLFALDATDLALSKLERNAERDREDVLRLAQAGLVDPHVLKERYYAELRPYLLSKLSWHDKTLDLWLQMAWPSTYHGESLRLIDSKQPAGRHPPRGPSGKSSLRDMHRQPHRVVSLRSAHGRPLTTFRTSRRKAYGRNTENAPQFSRSATTALRGHASSAETFRYRHTAVGPRP